MCRQRCRGPCVLIAMKTLHACIAGKNSRQTCLNLAYKHKEKILTAKLMLDHIEGKNSIQTLCSRNHISQKCVHYTSSLLLRIQQTTITANPKATNNDIAASCLCNNILTFNYQLYLWALEQRHPLMRTPICSFLTPG